MDDNDQRDEAGQFALPTALYFVVRRERSEGKDGYSAYWISRKGKQWPVGVHRETKQQCVTSTGLLHDGIYWNPEDQR